MSLRVLVFVFIAALLAAAVPAAAQIPIRRAGRPSARSCCSATACTRRCNNEELDKHVATPWPVWPVQPGALTPHGRNCCA